MAAAKHIPLKTAQSNPSDEPALPLAMKEEDKDALRLYGLSAAELLDHDLGEKGLAEKKTLEEQGRNTVDKLSHIWNKVRGKSSSQAYYDHLQSQFSGGKGKKGGYKYRKPERQVDRDAVEKYSEDYHIVNRNAKRPFLNPYGRKVWKYEDVDVYLSPSTSNPRRLIVMSTTIASKDHEGVTWRRAPIEGSVPLALRMAAWSLDPDIGWFKSTMRCLVVALPLQALLALPGANAPWEMGDVDDTYLDYLGYHWKWPKHAINPLDARITDAAHDKKSQPHSRKPQRVTSRQRLLRPRQLMVFNGTNWKIQENPPRDLQYVFVSYHWNSFEDLPVDNQGKDRVDAMAQALCQDAGIRAYFRDEHCVAKKTEGQGLRTADINSMCDVIRGSRFVALLLPDALPKRVADWGERLWTLPEGMLAPGNLQVYTFRAIDGSGKMHYDKRSMSKSELTSEFWHDEREDDDAPTRSLAEHYDGLTILSRLELFSAAVGALSVRKTSNDYTGADMGYALMGLLRYRIVPDPTDDVFQVVARLSFANDNDRLIERCMSLYPKPTTDMQSLLRMMAEEDQYYTHLWDIQPRCEVVGVGDEPNTVILNECRAVPIRWKKFPRIMYRRHLGIKKEIAQIVVRSGAWWMIMGYTLAYTYAPILISFETQASSTHWLWNAVLLFFGIGVLLSCFAPKAVWRLFGGKVLESAPHLVAFEGTMPKAELEKLIFGTNSERLEYEPSSTRFGVDTRHKFVRKGNEPAWIADRRSPPPGILLPGHRIFTLVDTGNLSISIFQAKRPPTVALITGAEGGMLRAVLCSWRFANDCHYRETVIRVPSSTWSQLTPTSWIKVSLQSQADFLSKENRPRFGAPKPAVLSPSHDSSEWEGDATAASKAGLTSTKTGFISTLTKLGPSARGRKNSHQNGKPESNEAVDPQRLGTAVVQRPPPIGSSPTVRPPQAQYEAPPPSKSGVVYYSPTSPQSTDSASVRPHGHWVTPLTSPNQGAGQVSSPRYGTLPTSTSPTQYAAAGNIPPRAYAPGETSPAGPRPVQPVQSPQAVGRNQQTSSTSPGAVVSRQGDALGSSPHNIHRKAAQPTSPSSPDQLSQSQGTRPQPAKSTPLAAAARTNPTQLSAGAQQTRNSLVSRYSTAGPISGREGRAERDVYSSAAQTGIPEERRTSNETRTTAEASGSRPKPPSKASTAEQTATGSRTATKTDSEKEVIAAADSSPVELSARVSSRGDFAPHSWEYWNGYDVDA